MFAQWHKIDTRCHDGDIDMNLELCAFDSAVQVGILDGYDLFLSHYDIFSQRMHQYKSSEENDRLSCKVPVGTGIQ